DFSPNQSERPRRAGRKPRADGVESRRAILHAAATLATTRGLDGLSLGELAHHIGMSKSGLFAHFKSKEELELATIETAAEVIAMLVRANFTWVVTGDPHVLDQARTGIQNALERSDGKSGRTTPSSGKRAARSGSRC